MYYANNAATFQILPKSGNNEVNPCPEAVTNDTAPTTTQNRKRVSPRCTESKKTVAKNQKRYICAACFDFTHAKYGNPFVAKFMSVLWQKNGFALIVQLVFYISYA